MSLGKTSVRWMVVLLVSSGCGGLGGDPPNRPPLVKDTDGKSYHLVARGPYKAFYDRWGRIQRIEYDSNGDGRPDRIAIHDTAKTPHRLNVDVDFDGGMDRFEDYSPDGKLRRFAVVDADGRARRWTLVGPNGETIGYEHDDDADGRVERTEHVVAGRIARVDLDTDRDGRPDRWQEWTGGRLVSETIDTNGDGRPDRRLRYAPGGGLAGVDRLSP